MKNIFSKQETHQKRIRSLPKIQLSYYISPTVADMKRFGFLGFSSYICRGIYVEGKHSFSIIRYRILNFCCSKNISTDGGNVAPTSQFSRFFEHLSTFNSSDCSLCETNQLQIILSY
jgi:hypothetical protein